MSLPNAKILETTILPDAGGVTVRLQIADAPLQSLDAASAGFHLALSVRLPAYQSPLLVHMEREAIDVAHTVLSALLRDLKDEIQPRHDLHPNLKD